jgi:hypothetical protein
MKKIYCFKCKEKQELKRNIVTFRATCETCGFDLHICKNCKFYSPGKPNDCYHPNTERVSDREKYNFCEDFSPNDNEPLKDKDIAVDSIEEKLFGKDSNKDQSGSKDFGSLFKD